MTAINNAVSSVQQLTQIQSQNDLAVQDSSDVNATGTLNRIQDTRDAINITGRDADNSFKEINVSMAKMDVELSQTELIVYDGELSFANIELQVVKGQIATKKVELAAEETRVTAAAAAAEAEAANIIATQNASFTERYQSEFSNVWDRDKDGTLNTTEVVSFGWKAEDWNQHVAKHDDSGDGKMNFNELLSVWREFDDNNDGELNGQYGANAETTSGELGTYWRGDYSNQKPVTTPAIVDNSASIRAEIAVLENKEDDYQAKVAQYTTLKTAAESNFDLASADLAKYEGMDETNFKDDLSTRKGIEQKSLDLTRRANNLGAFMANSALVATADFNDLGFSHGGMIGEATSADRRWRMNEVDYNDKGLEHSDVRNDKTARLISGLSRLAELSRFEEKSLEYDNFS